LAAGVPAPISHIMNKNKKQVTVNDPKYREILQSILPMATPVTNMIRRGVKRRGAGIKRF